MKIFPSDGISSKIARKYIYLDNDFLSQLFYDEIVLTEALTALKKSVFLIDTLTALEFLREVYLPEQYHKKKSFVSNPIFAPAVDHPDIYKHLQENALLLSRIYAHQNHNTKSDLVDLFLAARLMYSQAPLLITGNKKHFPSCIFNTLGVLNIEQSGDGSMRAFSIVQFNKHNFEQCNSLLEHLS